MRVYNEQMSKLTECANTKDYEGISTNLRVGKFHSSAKNFSAENKNFHSPLMLWNRKLLKQKAPPKRKRLFHIKPSLSHYSIGALAELAADAGADLTTPLVSTKKNLLPVVPETSGLAFAANEFAAPVKRKL